MSDRRIAKSILSYRIPVLAVAATVLVCGCSALVKEVFKPPKVRVTDVALASNPLEDPRGPVEFTLSLEIDNRNGYEISVADVAYSGIIGKETVASGEHAEDVTIAASGVTVVRVPLRVHPERFRTALRQVLAARSLPYEFNGSLGLRTPVAGVVRIPFSKTGCLDPVDFLRKKGFGLD